MQRSTPEPPPQQDSLGYRLTTSFPYLVRRVGLRIGELFDQAAAGYGVDVSMYRVLAALVEEDAQRLGRLSEITTIELSTLSRLVGTLSRTGLVTRQRPKANGRIVEIRLTPRGRELVAHLIPIAIRCERIAVAGLSAAEIARIKAQLVIAYSNLDVLEQQLQDETAGDATAEPGPRSGAAAGAADERDRD